MILFSSERIQLSLLLLVFLMALIELTDACKLKPTRFRTNNLRNPLAIASLRPVFSWALAFLDGSYSPSVTENYEDAATDYHQSAYRIICTEIRVEDSAQTDKVLWDSGKVSSQETLQIPYQGEPLKSLQRIQWSVQVWDQNGEECKYDDESPWFDTGLLDENAWGGAEWITRFRKPLMWNTSLCSMMEENDENQAPRFRTTFGISSKDMEDLVQIRAYVVGLGYYQMYINGNRVGDSLLDTAWTTASKRVFYAAHDVTSLIKDTHSQKHALGIELGNGWWNPHPILIFKRINLRIPLVKDQGMTSSRPMFRLHVYGFSKDGSVVSLLKSSSEMGWLAAGSPTVFNDIYLGEKYNAQLEPFYDGWTTVSYQPRRHNNYLCGCSWRSPVQTDASGLGKLEAQEIPPVRRQSTLTTNILSQNQTSDGGTIAILDTGKNHAGSCRIRIENQNGALRGQRVLLKYGELLTKWGELNVFTSVAGHITSKNPDVPCQPDVAAQQDVVQLGSRSLDWTPSWSWHGFRYIEMTLPPSLPLSDVSVECFTMRTDVDVVANFSSSDPWLSDLRQLVRNTFDSNLMSVQSDCPHRERVGYGGDALGCGEAGLSIYDFSAFYRKRILDYNDAQHVSNITGKLDGFTETAPVVGVEINGMGPGTGPIAWEAFQPEAQLWLYKYYGDTRTMHESLKHTRAYIDLLDSEPGGIENGLGDWLAVHGTNVAYTGLGFQRMSYLAYANITEILGMPPAIARHYRDKAAQLVDTINERFLRKDDSGAYNVGIKDRVGNARQTGQGMALFNGISHCQAARKKALLQLADNVRSASFLEGACLPWSKSTFQSECKTAIGGPGPHLTAGMLGIKWVLMALADGGLNDLTYDMLSADSYPGFRWMTNNQFANATTVWESFFFSDGLKSHNHPMFGSTEVWLLQSVAGIQPHPSARGMDHVLIRPNPPSQLSHASASYESPRGVFSVAWEKRAVADDEITIQLNATIPPNCHATVHVPASSPSDRLLYHGFSVQDARWIPSLLTDQGSFAMNVGSGFHSFRTTNSPNVDVSK